MTNCENKEKSQSPKLCDINQPLQNPGETPITDRKI